MLKMRPNNRGRYMVAMYHEGKRFDRQVHRLVLEAFAGRCPQDWEARHLDGNHHNNVISNLKWGTHAENMRDKISHGTSRMGGQRRAFTVEQVAEIRKFRMDGKTYQALADEFEVSKMVIWNLCNGITYTDLP